MRVRCSVYVFTHTQLHHVHHWRMHCAVEAVPSAMLPVVHTRQGTSPHEWLAKVEHGDNVLQKMTQSRLPWISLFTCLM